MTKASFVTEGSRIQALLAALMVYFVQLQEEYPPHINVMEG